jgi:hypothetical protein
MENKKQVGVDKNDTPLYAGDTVIDMDCIERTIVFDRYREKFDCGYVEGYFIPDGCVKKFPLYKQEKEMDECLQPDMRKIYLEKTIVVDVLNKRPPSNER